MSYEEIKAEARLRELSVIGNPKRGYTLSESRSGKSLGRYGPGEEEALLLAVNEYPVIEVRPVVYVGWNTQIPQSAPPGVKCPNNLGPECFCLDTTIPYAVCGYEHCPARARCRGVCIWHLGQTHGKDYVQQALRNTDHYIKEHGLDIDNPPVDNGTKYRPFKNIQQTGTLRTVLNPAELNEIADGTLGITVKYIPEQGLYQILDKDANILDTTNNREDLFWSDQ